MKSENFYQTAWLCLRQRDCAERRKRRKEKKKRTSIHSKLGLKVRK